ncbi:MAG TPA: hypothetical protein VF606_11845 [Geminicoccaceae bacterium]
MTTTSSGGKSIERPSDPGEHPGADEGSRPGVMGDGTIEQNIGQPGNPGAKITQEEVEEAFGGKEEGGKS